MASVNIGIVELDYSISYPSISFEVSIVIPDNIPVVGDKRYDLGGTSISLQNPSVTFPVSIWPLSGQITFALDTTHTEFSVSGEIDLDVTVYSHDWPIGPAYFQYMKPFILTEPYWSVNPEKIDAGALQAAINGAPDSKVHSAGGATALHNDPATQELIRGLLLFAGAEGFVDQMTSYAQRISDSRSRMLTRAAGAGSESATSQQSAQTTSGDALIAFALGMSAGAVAGLTGAYGLYFTTSGSDFGTFGSLGLDIGLLGEISVGPTALIYWPDAGLSAKECFGGNNGFVGFDAGELFTGSLTIYWPEDTLTQVTSFVPCGVGIGVGAGGGLPFNFFVGNSDTLLMQTPPPQLHPHGH
jgi:hypothetical protein